MDSVVISVRVRKEVKTKLEEEGVDVQHEVKMFLEHRASQAQLKKALDRIEKLLKERSRPSKKGFAVRSIREDRNAAH
jgi:hypothetical protein